MAKVKETNKNADKKLSSVCKNMKTSIVSVYKKMHSKLSLKKNNSKDE